MRRRSRFPGHSQRRPGRRAGRGGAPAIQTPPPPPRTPPSSAPAHPSAPSGPRHHPVGSPTTPSSTPAHPPHASVQVPAEVPKLLQPPRSAHERPRETTSAHQKRPEAAKISSNRLQRASREPPEPSRTIQEALPEPFSGAWTGTRYSYPPNRYPRNPASTSAMTPPTPRAGATVPAGASPGALPCQPEGRARASACQPRGRRRAARGPWAPPRRRGSASDAGAPPPPVPPGVGVGVPPGGIGVGGMGYAPPVAGAPPRLPPDARPPDARPPDAGARRRGSPPGLRAPTASAGFGLPARRGRARGSPGARLRGPTADRRPPGPGASAATSTADRPRPGSRCPPAARPLPGAGPLPARDTPPRRPRSLPRARPPGVRAPTAGGRPWLSGHRIAICGDFCHRGDAGAAISGGCPRAARQISGG
jgi:hypothetical protein